MIVADSETAGMFGPIRLIGWYDGLTYQVSPDPRAWWEDVREREEVIYFHNLDFDLGKLTEALGWSITWDKTLLVNNRVVRVPVEGARFVLADSFALLPASLDDLCRDFDLPAALKKRDLEPVIRAGGYRDKEDYFTRVPVDDPVYRDYLEHDVRSLYEILTRLRTFADFSPDEFARIPTASSLAMRAFAKRHPYAYEMICRPHLTPHLEGIFRDALAGGRTELYQVEVRDAWHYDNNGLYPYVMGAYEYPVGYPEEATGEAAVARWGAFLSGAYTHAIVEATVLIPDEVRIPPLPYRLNGRLTFPTGELTGTWVGAEIQEALTVPGVVVLDVTRILTWQKSYPYFTEWSGLIARMKERSRGAERATWKLLGNGLFGKFGMKRLRPKIRRDTPANRQKLTEKGLVPAVWYPGGDYSHPYLETLEPVWAPYIQPQIAAHITAYARITLYRELRAAERDGAAVYCDTDSVVRTTPMDPAQVHPKEGGKWKLEGRVLHGIFLQPKLYAERREREDVLRSKGMVSQWREDARFETYEKLLARIRAADWDTVQRKPALVLYEKVPVRRKFASAMKAGIDPDRPLLLTKAIRPMTWPKRRTDFVANQTWPWNVNDLLAQEEERARMREERRWRRQEWKALRRRLWHALMPRGVRDADYPDLPRALIRRHGWGLDVWATELGYAGPDALYADIMQVYS